MKKKITKKIMKSMTLMELGLVPYLLSGHIENMSLLKRYAKVLEKRASRFFIKNNLDSYTVREDLYDYNVEEEYSKGKTQEEIEKKLAKSKPGYCNLVYSEKEDRKYKIKEVEDNAKLAKLY